MAKVQATESQRADIMVRVGAETARRASDDPSLLDDMEAFQREVILRASAHLTAVTLGHVLKPFEASKNGGPWERAECERCGFSGSLSLANGVAVAGVVFNVDCRPEFSPPTA